MRGIGVAMAKITIKKPDGEFLEISDIQLTVQEIKELAGMNGHGNTANKRTGRERKQAVSVRINDATPDYSGFKKALSESGKKFENETRTTTYKPGRDISQAQ